MTANNKSSFFRRLAFLIWVAFLAFALPEVFAGSGANWLIRLDFYLLGIPLYALHFLLLCHLAVKTRRTSWPALYLFGIIFALYESWITKVIWTGYPGSGGFASGGIGDWFGVHETFALVFFYHPVTSFLLPLAVLSRLFPAFGAHFPVPNWVFGTGKWAAVRRVGLLLMWGILSGRNMPMPEVFLLTWLPTIIIIWLGYLLIKPQLSDAVTRPTMGKFGVAIVVIWLALIYGVTYLNLSPEKLPPQSVQWLTLAFYPVLAGLIWWTLPQGKHGIRALPERRGSMPLIWLLLVFSLGLLMSVLSGFMPVLAINLFFMSMILLGTVLFIWLVMWGALVRRGQRRAKDHTYDAT